MTRFLKDYFLQYTNQKFRLPLKEFFMRSGKNLGSVQRSGNRFFFVAGNGLTRKSAASSSTASRSTFHWKNIGRGFESSLAYNVSVSTFASKRGFSVEEWGFRKKNLRGYFFLATETGFFCRVISRFESLKIISRHFSIDLSQKCYNREHSGQKSKAASKRKRKMVLPYKWIIHLYYN